MNQVPIKKMQEWFIPLKVIGLGGMCQSFRKLLERYHITLIEHGATWWKSYAGEDGGVQEATCSKVEGMKTAG